MTYNQHEFLWRAGNPARQLAIVAAPCIAGGIVHHVFDIGTPSQFAYYLLGVLAALVTWLMASSTAGWGKLLAAQVFITLGFVPRLIFPIFTGTLDMTFAQAIYLLLVPGVFVGAFLAGDWLYSRLDGLHAARFTAAMALVAFAMHALLLPFLLGEPLRAHIIQVDPAGEEIVATNPDGTLALTHTALVPLNVTLYRAEETRLAAVLDTSLPGYPVGLRVFEDHALMALRIENEAGNVERINFVKLTVDGVSDAGHFPCTPAQNPGHLINNLSPDGRLLALADGTFVEVATGTIVTPLPEDANPEGALVFAEWTEPEGRAVFFDGDNSRLVLLYTRTGVVDRYELRGHPSSPLALSVAPGAGQVWYEEEGLFPNWQRAFLEDLGDQSRIKLAQNRGKGRFDSLQLWARDTLTYITALGALDTLEFDRTYRRYRRNRHTQLYEMATHAALAREEGWLFWITQAPHGEGTAIHRKKFPEGG